MKDGAGLDGNMARRAARDESQRCMTVHTFRGRNPRKSLFLRFKVYIFRLTGNIPECYTLAQPGGDAMQGSCGVEGHVLPTASDYTHRKYGVERLVP
jgi:hypothetical protein